MDNHHVEWVKPLFRLGHVQYSFLYVYSRGYKLFIEDFPVFSHFPMKNFPW